MPKSRYYRRPDGLYETSRTVNGKRIKFRGRTCAEVDRKILEFQQVKEKGRKFPEIADEWWEDHRKTVSISTEMAYRSPLKRLREEFPGYARDIRPLDFQRVIRNFEAEGYAASTVNMLMAVAKQIFAHAVIAGDIDVNPAREVSISRGLPRKKRAALTVEQEQAVITRRDVDGWLIGYLLLFTGCRRGELLALQWQDIDRAAGVIHITKKLNYARGARPILENHLKSENGKRDIPLLSPLADALPRDCIGAIFTEPDGSYINESHFKRQFREYCRAIGLPENITPHCFRHSFATICYEAGVDAKAAAAYFGDTEEVMRGVYQELRDGQRESGAQRLNDFVAARAAR